jgi:hypothetical protein
MSRFEKDQLLSSNNFWTEGFAARFYANLHKYVGKVDRVQSLQL